MPPAPRRSTTRKRPSRTFPTRASGPGTLWRAAWSSTFAISRLPVARYVAEAAQPLKIYHGIEPDTGVDCQEAGGLGPQGFSARAAAWRPGRGRARPERLATVVCAPDDVVRPAPSRLR